MARRVEKMFYVGPKPDVRMAVKARFAGASDAAIGYAEAEFEEGQHHVYVRWQNRAVWHHFVVDWDAENRKWSAMYYDGKSFGSGGKPWKWKFRAKSEVSEMPVEVLPNDELAAVLSSFFNVPKRKRG